MSVLRRAQVLPAACLALALVAGCAVNHSDDFVSLAMTSQVGARPEPLTNVDVVVVGGQFGPTTTKGKFAPGTEMIANRQLGTLLPAVGAQLPAVLQRNGIPARLLGPGGRPTADQVVTVKPQLAQEQVQGSYSVVGIQLLIEIRRRDGQLLWVGTSLERASPSRADSMQWSDAMAEDLARTLLIRLRREGLVKLGAGGDADPV